jgi:hypothetical protein
MLRQGTSVAHNEVFPKDDFCSFLNQPPPAHPAGFLQAELTFPHCTLLVQNLVGWRKQTFSKLLTDHHVYYRSRGRAVSYCSHRGSHPGPPENSGVLIIDST